MPEVTIQNQTLQTQALESEPIEAWLLKKVFKIVSVTDANVTVIPRNSGARFESLSSDHTALATVDVDWFKPSYGFIIDAYDVGKIMRGLPWSRLLVRISIRGRSLSVHSVDGSINATVDIIEKPESITDGVIEQYNGSAKAVLKVDAFKLWSWFRPFSVVHESRARFKVLYSGIILEANNEDALLMLDAKLIPEEYNADGIFEVSYRLDYAVSFLEEVKRNGAVTAIIAKDKPLLIESMMERGAKAYLVQAPMVE